MRLPWISRRSSDRAATRRKKSAPLRVRQLERRRVLNASVTDIVFAPADLDAATAVHDSNEGAQVTATATASGTGQLFYEWTLKQGASTVAQSFNSTFQFTPLDDASYSLTVKVVDSTQSSATRTEDILVHNVRPVLVVAPDQPNPPVPPLNEGSLVNLSGVGAPPLGLFIDDGKLDTHTATVDWGDGSGPVVASVLEINGSGAILGTHTYNDNGLFKVDVTVTDDDGGSDTQSFFVTVTNVAPTGDFTNGGPVSEGSPSSVSFQNQFDPSSVDTAAGFHYAYDFNNDGTFDVGDGTYAGSVTNDSQTVAANFLDDGPGTGTVRAWIIDKNGGHTEYTTGIAINNVDPTAAFGNNGPVPEGSPATVTFSNQFDPSTADTLAGFHYAYDFNNDGTFDVGDGTYGGSTPSSSQMVSPALLADDPGPRTVRAWIIDKDGGQTEYFTDIAITNADPTLINIHVDDDTIDEGKTATISMTINDPGALDVFEVDVDWKDGPVDTIAGLGLVNASGTFGGTDYHWDAQSRELTVTHLYRDDNPTATVSDLKTVALTVRDDDLGHSGPYNVDITVNNVRPVLVVAVPQTILEGQELDLGGMGAPALGLFIDDGKLDAHTAIVDWGDGSGPEPASILEINGSGAVLGKHTYADDGNYLVTVTVTDDDTGFATDSFQVSVGNVDPTLAVTPSPTSIDEGQSVSFDAMFSDPGFDNPANPNGPSTESFTYDVNWGDGRDAINGMPVDDTNGGPGVLSTGSFNGSHTYADNGTYTVTVTIHDDDGGVDVEQFMVTVANVDPTLGVTPSPTSINEGQSVSFDATFSDPGFDNPFNPGAEKEESFTYDVNWGDGRDAITGMTVSDMGGMPGTDSTGSFNGSHTYADDGTYTVTVTIHDDDGGVDVEQFMVTVANVDPTLALPNGDQTINEGALLSLTKLGTFSDPGFDNSLNPSGETAESFTYDVDWGDGRNAINGMPVDDTNGSPGVLSTGSFNGSHTYADNGTYTVRVTIHDDDGGVDVRMFTVIVANVDPTLSGTSGLVVNEGDSITLTGLGVGLQDPGFDNPFNTLDPANGGELTETFDVMKINWGDGSIDDNTDADLTDLVSIVNRVSGSVGNPTTAQFSHAAHTYADNGLYTVTVTIKDDDGGFVDRTFTITVDNVRPTLTPTGNQTVDESQDLVLPIVGTFSDPGFDNPANPGGATSESFRYFLDWGDGREQIGSLAVADLDGSPGTPSSGMFGGAHNYADNGVYTVTIRIADDDMIGNFAGGENGVDYVEQTFTVTVNNLAPSFVPQPNGANFQGDDLNTDGITTIRVAYNDPGYDNPLNTLASNGGETFETFNHVVQWGDGTVDTIHQYTTNGAFTVTVTMTPSGGSPQQFTFANFNSASPVLTLVSSQQLNDPAVVSQVVTYVVHWGDGDVETFQLSLLNPGLPVDTNGLTTLVASARDSGNATTLTTGSAEVQHRYLGPPDPLHPTADIKITLTVSDDDGAGVTDAIAVSNPGIQTINVAIDTTPDVPRLDLTQQPMIEVFIPNQGGLAQALQVPDVRGGGGEVAATTERYLELRIVFPDGTESQGFRIKDEALADLRKFFKTLPDGRYRIYLVRTENHSERLVIEVDVRRGRVVDVSDDSEGTRDRPPTGEEEAPQAVPLNQNPQLQTVPGAGSQGNTGSRQGDTATRRQGEGSESRKNDNEQLSLSPPLLVSLSVPAAALVDQPWSRRVDEALAGADDTAWKRLRRAGRRCRPTTQTLVPPRMRTVANLDYNRI